MGLQLYRNLLFILFLFQLFSSCTSNNKDKNFSKDYQIHFKKVPSDVSNIYFSNNISEDGKMNILEYQYLYNGGGVAILDINNDGLPDIYFTGNMVSNKLYLNKGNLVFEDITEFSGTQGSVGWHTGVTVVDINNDGFMDLYVCKSGDVQPQFRKNELYVNQGDNTFLEQAAKFGLDDQGYSTQAVFFDYDGDGDLDMFLLNHGVRQYDNINAIGIRYDRDLYTGDKLYKNELDSKGVFINVTEDAGIKESPIGFGLGVAIGDLNNDCFPDIYVGNDFFEDDYLYINLGNGSFRDDLKSLVRSTSKFTMGVAISDLNNDKINEIFSLDMRPANNQDLQQSAGQDPYDVEKLLVKNGFYPQYMRNTLQLGRLQGGFSEVAQLSGVASTDWSWSPIIGDFDNDGLRDIYITNGIKRDFTDKDFIKYQYAEYAAKAIKQGKKPDFSQIIKFIPEKRISNYCFRNVSSNSKPPIFSDVTKTWGLEEPSISNGGIYADLDADGDLDLIINNLGSEAFIYENRMDKIKGNGFLQVKLIGHSNNINAVGAKVSVYTNGTVSMQENYFSKGFQSATSDILHFGLGQAEQVDSLIVQWDCNTVSKLKNQPINKRIKITYNDQLVNTREYKIKTLSPIFEEIEVPDISYSHKENKTDDFQQNGLLPYKLNSSGPRGVVGDLDGNGTDDIFISNSAGESPELFLQFTDKQFVKKNGPWSNGLNSEIMDVSLFDIDGDEDLDLIFIANVITSDFIKEKTLYIYENDGFANFKLFHSAHYPENIVPSCIAVSDFDNDGDLDIFIGAGTNPKLFGQKGTSLFIINDKGKFTKVLNDDLGLESTNFGMVSDAIWKDLDGNGWEDLIVVGKWMPIIILMNYNGRFIREEVKGSSGWWTTIGEIKSGDKRNHQFVIGNRGLNSSFTASEKAPMLLFRNDFDENGLDESIITYNENDRDYPVESFDELKTYLPFIKRKFLSYKNYSNASIEEILPKNLLYNKQIQKVETFASSILHIEEEQYLSLQSLPLSSQVSSIDAFVSFEHQFIKGSSFMVAGNNSHVKSTYGGDINAGYGEIFTYDEEGCKSLDNIFPAIEGKVSQLFEIKIGKENVIVVMRNNQSPLFFKSLSN